TELGERAGGRTDEPALILIDPRLPRSRRRVRAKICGGTSGDSAAKHLELRGVQAGPRNPREEGAVRAEGACPEEIRQRRDRSVAAERIPLGQRVEDVAAGHRGGDTAHEEVAVGGP